MTVQIVDYQRRPNKMENTAIYAECMAFMTLKKTSEPIAYYKLTSKPTKWGFCVKNYNKKDFHNRSYYKSSEKGVVLEAAFKGPDNWWQVFKKIIPPKNAYIIDASKIELRI